MLLLAVNTDNITALIRTFTSVLILQSLPPLLLQLRLPSLLPLTITLCLFTLYLFIAVQRNAMRWIILVKGEDKRAPFPTKLYK